MATNPLDTFVAGLRTGKGGAMCYTAKELREAQFGFPLAHYAQQYLFGATGLRIQVFNSIQGEKEAGKSTFAFDLAGHICADREHGGLEGMTVIYELEGKISPTVLHSILAQYGERAEQWCQVVPGLTLGGAMAHLNQNVLPVYRKVAPKLDVPLFVVFDSIGGSAEDDTIAKLEKDGVTGKGFYDKQHFMKYWCENQGAIFYRLGIPIVVLCVNQEREKASSSPGYTGAPQKVITGGRAQLFKDGHMLRASKSALKTGDGNVLRLSTAKTSFCDARKLDVLFRWNKHGRIAEDAYEARFEWALASAQFLADPSNGVGDLREICDVKVSADRHLVTCPQLDLKSVEPEEFEQALFANAELLDRLYTFHKIERLRDLSTYAEYLAAQKSGKSPDDEPEKEEKPKAKPKSKAKSKSKAKADVDEALAEAVPLFEIEQDEEEQQDAE